MTPYVRILVTLLAILVLPGCADVEVNTPPATASYALILVNDKPLPAVIATSSFGGKERVVFGSLVMSGNTIGQQTQYDEIPVGGMAMPTILDSLRSTFTLRNEVIVLKYLRRDVPVADTGYFDGTVLILQQRLKTSLGLPTAQRFTLKYARH